MQPIRLKWFLSSKLPEERPYENRWLPYHTFLEEGLNLCIARWVLGFIFFTSSVHAATAVENDALALFDAMCISTEADMAVIERMAIASGAKAVPPDALSLDQAMSQDDGKAFVVKHNGRKFLLAVTKKRACSVLISNVSSAKLKRLIQDNYSLSAERKESSGPKIVSLWKIVPPSIYKGGIVSLTSFKKGFGVDNAVTLGFMPRGAPLR